MCRRRGQRQETRSLRSERADAKMSEEQELQVQALVPAAGTPMQNRTGHSEAGPASSSA